jgi:hypothetical protein
LNYLGHYERQRYRYKKEVYYFVVCHPCCVFKLYGEVNSVKNTAINIRLNDGVYWQWEKLHVSAYSGHLQVLTTFLVYGKAVLLQAWTGPEGSRKLRFPDFVTTAQNGGRLSALGTGRLYPQEMLLVLISVRG